jgi:hypothetical protein
MSDDLIAKLIDEMATYDRPFHFSPFKVNEPLLDKRLKDICKTVEEPCWTSASRISARPSRSAAWRISGCLPTARP